MQNDKIQKKSSGGSAADHGGRSPRTLTKAVQKQASGEENKEEVHQLAQTGVQGSGSRLPHAAAIQRAFGKHDVSNVQAHVGGAAADAAKGIGAEAYATGNSVAFQKSPDLHTAAHEAAHVVQQRGGVQLKGGVGQVGDKYEQHADAVADKVVQGGSAEGLLDQMAGSSNEHSVQRLVVQLVERDDQGRPVRDDREFTFPAEEAGIERRVIQWIGGLVSRSRAEGLVRNSESWETILPTLQQTEGSPVELTVELVWNENRVTDLQFGTAARTGSPDDGAGSDSGTSETSTPDQDLADAGSGSADAQSGDAESPNGEGRDEQSGLQERTIELRIRRVPDSYEVLRDAVEQEIAREVLSRTEVEQSDGSRQPAHRERELVANSNLEELYEEMTPGDRVELLNARLIPNEGGSSYQQLVFEYGESVVQGETIRIEGRTGLRQLADPDYEPSNLPDGEEAQQQYLEILNRRLTERGGQPLNPHLDYHQVWTPTATAISRLMPSPISPFGAANQREGNAVPREPIERMRPRWRMMPEPHSTTVSLYHRLLARLSGRNHMLGAGQELSESSIAAVADDFIDDAVGAKEMKVRRMAQLQLATVGGGGDMYQRDLAAYHQIESICFERDRMCIWGHVV